MVEDPPEAIARLTDAQRMERGRSQPFGLQVFINPVLRLLDAKRTTFPEGCLSIPGYAALVERNLRVEVSSFDRAAVRHDWTAVAGWPARILQHEIDHLDGTLYTDRMIPRSFMTDEHMKSRTAERPIAAVLRDLGQ